MDKVLETQLLGDLCADLEEGGQEAHQLPEAAGSFPLLVRVFFQHNVAASAVLTNYISPVPQAAGLCMCVGGGGGGGGKGGGGREVKEGRGEEKKP